MPSFIRALALSCRLVRTSRGGLLESGCRIPRGVINSWRSNLSQSAAHVVTASAVKEIQNKTMTERKLKEGFCVEKPCDILLQGWEKGSKPTVTQLSNFSVCTMLRSNCTPAVPPPPPGWAAIKDRRYTLGTGMCRRNVCAGIRLPVGTVEKDPAHQLIPDDKGPDRPRLYVSAWRRCPGLIPAPKKVDPVGKRRGRAHRRQVLCECQHTPCQVDSTATHLLSPHPAATASTPNKRPHASSFTQPRPTWPDTVNNPYLNRGKWMKWSHWGLQMQEWRIYGQISPKTFP